MAKLIPLKDIPGTKGGWLLTRAAGWRWRERSMPDAWRLAFPFVGRSNDVSR